MPCDLYFFAGETSGDLHAEGIVRALKTHNPDICIAGVAGPKMRAAGVVHTIPMEAFQVMGFLDVFWALPRLIRQFYQVVREIERLQPKVVITIDYPGFNLRLMRHLKKKGFKGKCIHFISPSVWAWGKKRIPLMAQVLDQLLTILPFEKALFKETPLAVTYVGHPLVERLQSHTYRPLALPQGKKIVSLFPGSRRKEIERNLPLYLRAAKDLAAVHPDLHFALSVSEERFRPLILEILKKEYDPEKITLVDSDDSYALMRASYLAIAKSGTVTLELALHHIPTVVTYAISPIDVFIARDILQIRLPHYCLVNIIAEKEIFPELFGPHFTLATLKQNIETLLQRETYASVRTQCSHLVEQLSSKKTSEEVAERILSWNN